MRSSRVTRSTRASGPVEIVYYPKRVRAPRRQSVETALLDPQDTSGERPRKTLTDEQMDPSEKAFGDLARVGHEAFQAGRAAEAQTIFESIVALGHRQPFVHTMLGTIHLGAQRIDDALAQFEAALALDADDLVALVYRAEIRITRRKWARATDDLERAVGLAPAADPFVQRARKLLTLAKANRTA